MNRKCNDLFENTHIDEINELTVKHVLESFFLKSLVFYLFFDGIFVVARKLLKMLCIISLNEIL